MKLEVGMYYTRSKKGELGLCKCGNLTPKEFVETYKNTYDIKNASYNIMDLIEVGDYVNGKQVIKINTDYIFDYSEEILLIYFSEEDYIYSSADIKSIVTKEQFESMSYKVGE